MTWHPSVQPKSRRIRLPCRERQSSQQVTISVSMKELSMSSLLLEPDRALPFPAEQRSVAREIYAETKDLPLICMHGHVEPEVFAEDPPFADPAQLLIIPDHYVFRMLASQGIEPAQLGCRGSKEVR